MGFFNKPVTSIDGLGPLTVQRIAAALDSLEWKYKPDEDGDIVAGWEHGYFHFLPQGKKEDILHVRGSWYGQLTEADQIAADGLCSDWNRNTIWPKAYTVLLDDGVVRISAEHSVHYEHGLTDAQLRQHLLCAVLTANELFEKVVEAFPKQAKAYLEG